MHFVCLSHAITSFCAPKKNIVEPKKKNKQKYCVSLQSSIRKSPLCVCECAFRVYIEDTTSIYIYCMWTEDENEERHTDSIQTQSIWIWGKQKTIVFVTFRLITNNSFNRIEVRLIVLLHTVEMFWNHFHGVIWCCAHAFALRTVRGEKHFWVYPIYHMHGIQYICTRIESSCECVYVCVCVRWRNGRANSMAKKEEESTMKEMKTFPLGTCH